MIKYIFICLLFSFCFSQWSSSSWRDSKYGGVFYVCINNNNHVDGAYSEFGIIQGTLSNNEIIGNWYEGGINNCNTGDFSLEINSSGNQYSGFWRCDNDNSINDWTGILIGGITTTSSKRCAILGNFSLSGIFEEISLSDYDYFLCSDNNDYNASYRFIDDDDNQTLGYEYGHVHTSNIASGVWEEDTGLSGISLIFTLSDGTLGNMWWQYDDDGSIFPYQDYYNDDHDYIDFLYKEESDDNDCSRYSDIISDNNDDDDNDDNDDDDNYDDDNNNNNDDDNDDDDDDNDNDDDNDDDDNNDYTTSSSASITASLILLFITLLLQNI